MSRISIEQYIEERLDGQYAYYSKAATQAKRKYQTIKALEILLAACVPFLAAMISPELMLLKVVVGLLGLAVTVLSGLLLMYKYQENWVSYRSTAEALKSEKYRFLARSGPYKRAGSNALFVEKIEAILGEENQKWQDYVFRQEDKEEEEIRPETNPPSEPAS